VTPGFSPPEQYADSLTDGRSDLYSVGATMYFLLTGVAPAPAPARASGDQKLLPPSQLVPSISTGAEMVVRKALSLPRDQRWSSAAEMRQMVDETAQRLAAKPDAGRKAPPPPRPGRSPSAPARGRAKPRPLLLGLFAGIVGVAALAAFLLSRPGSDLTAAATPPAAATAAANPTATLAAPTPTPAPVTPTPAPATPTRAGDEATQEAPAEGQATPPPTSTSIPTRTPIPTPRPAAATVVRPAPTAPPAPAPASAAAPANVTVALLEPNEGDTRDGEVTFRWSVTGGVPAGQGFEVFFYRPGEDPLTGGFGLAAPTSGSSVQVDLPGLDATAGYPLEPGTYLWGVRLVQGGRPVRVVAEGRRLVYQRPQQAQPVQPSQPAEPTSMPTDIP
jgi:hypothetical protein